MWCQRTPVLTWVVEQGDIHALASVSIVKNCGDTTSKIPLVAHWVRGREFGGAVPEADDVMETLVEKGEISTFI